MQRGLAGFAASKHRFQQCGSLHFVPFSCYQRLAHLGNRGRRRDVLARAGDGAAAVRKGCAWEVSHISTQKTRLDMGHPRVG